MSFDKSLLSRLYICNVIETNMRILKTTAKNKFYNCIQAIASIVDNLIMILTLGNVLSTFSLKFIGWKLKQSSLK